MEEFQVSTSDSAWETNVLIKRATFNQSCAQGSERVQGKRVTLRLQEGHHRHSMNNQALANHLGHISYKLHGVDVEGTMLPNTIPHPCTHT